MKLGSSRLKSSIVIGLVAVVGLAGAITTACLADDKAGNAGEGNDVTGGGCGSPTKTSWFDTCYGATWKYYTAESNSVTIPDEGHVRGGEIKDCAYQIKTETDPASGQTTQTRVEIGGYYRLGLEKYNPSIYHSNRQNPAAASLGAQAGIIKNGDLRLLNGNISFVVTNDSITLEDANARFQTALSYGVVPENITWNGNLGWFCYNAEWGNTTTPPTNPPDNPGASAGNGYYYATSTVDIPAQAHDVSHHNVTSEGEDGEVIVKLSTDRSEFTANFWHTLYYKHTNGSGKFDDANTYYTVSETIDGRVTRDNIESDDFLTNGGANASKGNLGRSSGSVHLNEGETKTICHIIDYHDKTISFSSDLGGWDTMTGGGDSGSSKACVEVTRPTNPTGSTYSTVTMPRVTGSVDGTIMYTGETATIGWKDIAAKTVPTRRYSAYREIVYTPVATQNYHDGITTGNLTTTPRNRNDPCTYYNGKSMNAGCAIVENQVSSGTLNPGAVTDSMRHNRPELIVVPDYVGYKYCNSFGWQFQYWVSYTQNGEDHWFKEDKDYWTTYDAACRTIAKKPTSAIWNGSILSNGGLLTSLAERYDDTHLGRIKGSSTPEALYGSWSEYLGVVGKQVNGFGSGASLALGSRISLDLYVNSPLTIANTSTNLGHSGVFANPTLRTRLDTFLKSHAEVYDGNRTSSGANSLNLNSNITDSRIIHVKGDLDITENIILNPGPYTSIYHVPQVVIFIDGNVRVASQVTQIDAWIITNGSLDTCSDFVAGGYRDGVLINDTQSDAVNRPIETCNKQLAFNGPVMASSLILHRSYGSDPHIYRNNAYNRSVMNNSEHSERYSAGEIFNYRADSYLWAYSQAGRYDSSYTESYTRELAPRY